MKTLQRALDEISGQPTRSQPAHGRVPERTHLVPPTTQSGQSTKEQLIQALYAEERLTKRKKLLALLEQPKPSRKSLPSTFNQPKQPPQDRINKTNVQPRHSLPAQPHPRSRPPPPTVRQSSSMSASGLPQPDVAINTEIPSTTGDPFRDYFFAVQRSTSWTGSTKVSSKPSSTTTDSRSPD